MLRAGSAWLSSAQLTALKGLVREWGKANQGAELTAEVARDLLEQVPSDQALVVDRALLLLRSNGLLGDGANIQAARNMNDIHLKKLIARQG